MRAILCPRPKTFSRGALASALALAACFGSWDREVEETRAGLIGKTGLELRGCLGVPTDFDQRGDVELLTFRFAYSPGRSVVPPVTTRRGVGMPEPMPFPPDSERQGFCQLDFELGEKGVTKVGAQGRDDHGLRADNECLMRARPCVDPSYAE